MYCLRMLRSQSVVSVCIESKFVHSFIHELLYRVLLPCHCLSPPSSSLYVHITRTITVQHKLWMCRWLEEQPSFTSLTDLTQYSVNPTYPYTPSLLKILSSTIQWFCFSVHKTRNIAEDPMLFEMCKKHSLYTDNVHLPIRACCTLLGCTSVPVFFSWNNNAYN